MDAIDGMGRKQSAEHADTCDVTKRDIIDNMGRKQRANYINESGLYALIFGSTKDEAKRFKRWVTYDVLPTIRKLRVARQINSATKPALV